MDCSQAHLAGLAAIPAVGMRAPNECIDADLLWAQDQLLWHRNGLKDDKGDWRQAIRLQWAFPSIGN